MSTENIKVTSGVFYGISQKKCCEAILQHVVENTVGKQNQYRLQWEVWI